MGWWASEQNWGDCQDYLSGANKMKLKSGSGKKCWTPALPLHAAPSVVSCNPIIYCSTKGPLEEVNTEEYKICYWPWTHLRHNDETLFICRLPFTTTMQEPSNWMVCITFDFFIILRLTWCYQVRLGFVERDLFTLKSSAIYAQKPWWSFPQNDVENMKCKDNLKYLLYR